MYEVVTAPPIVVSVICFLGDGNRAYLTKIVLLIARLMSDYCCRYEVKGLREKESLCLLRAADSSADAAPDILLQHPLRVRLDNSRTVCCVEWHRIYVRLDC